MQFSLNTNFHGVAMVLLGGQGFAIMRYDCCDGKCFIQVSTE